jgi:hypothetical protein
MLDLKCNLNFLTESDSPTITPAMAQELLDNSRCIKPLRSLDVSRLVREFDNDNFEFNGATIVLDENGHLIDGQTRLAACVESGKSFKSYIVYGVETEGQYTKDTGRSRNVVQYLGTHGYKFPRALSASAQIIHNILLAHNDDTKDGIVETNRVTATHQELMDIIEAEPKLQDCVNKLFPRKHQYLTSAIYHLIVLDYLHRHHDNNPELADEFLDVLSGVRAEPLDHPVTQLRRIFMNNIQRSTTRMNKTKQALYMIKAYNHLRQNISCRGLRLGKHTPRLDMLQTTKGDS